MNLCHISFYSCPEVPQLLDACTLLPASGLSRRPELLCGARRPPDKSLVADGCSERRVERRSRARRGAQWRHSGGGRNGNVQREAGFVRVDVDVPSGPVPTSDGAVKSDFALPYKVGLEFDAGRQIDAADPSAASPPADFALLLLLDDVQMLDTKCAQPTPPVPQLVPPPERPPPTTAAPPAVVVVTTKQATTVTTSASTSSSVAVTSNMADKVRDLPAAGRERRRRVRSWDK